MNLEQIFKEYPVGFDIFALVIFLGTVQGIFLSLFFWTKKNREIKSNFYLGLLLIASSILSLDILISYTNIMFRVLHLVDISEPFNFIIGPSFYLYIKSKCDESSIKKPWIHFIPYFIYLIYSILFLTQGIEAKYNAYIDQYHPELEFVREFGYRFTDPLYFKHFINELTLFSIFAYIVSASAVLFRFGKKTIVTDSIKKHLNFLWFDVFVMSVIFIVIVWVKLQFGHDLGDHIIIIAITLMIYIISFKVIRESIFFQTPKNERKYRKSGLDEEAKDLILSKIMHFMNEEKLFMNPNFSLPGLSKKVGFSPNYVSQVINERLILSFPEMLAKNRVEEAKRLILDPNNSNTIEGIAYSVGYNSKSAFFSAFKKFTGKTPLEFKSINNKN